MHLDPDIHSHDLRALVRQLFEVEPKKRWLKRAQELDHREKRNPALGDYFDDKYPIERTLARTLEYDRRFHRYPDVQEGGGPSYELYSFIAAFVRVHRKLSTDGKKRLMGMLKDGLGSDAGLAPLALELAVAIHLARAGFDVDFADLERRAQFDILATKEGGVELEIDCKTASGDVGRPIHRRRAVELFGRLRPELSSLASNLSGGRLIHIVLPGSLHGHDDYMNRLVALVKEVAATGPKQRVEDVAEITSTNFAIEDDWFSRDERPPLHDELAVTVQRLVGNSNINAMSIHRPGRALVVAIESRRPDKVLEGVYRSLRDSAEDQFTRARPAVLAVRLTDLTGENLKTLMAQSRNGLAAIAQRLFTGARRAHLREVVFLARGGLHTSPGPLSGVSGFIMSDHGIAASFVRNEHPTAMDRRFEVFR